MTTIVLLTISNIFFYSLLPLLAQNLRILLLRLTTALGLII